MGQEAIPWIMLVATVLAAAAAIMAWKQAVAVNRSTTSSNLVNCLMAYITIMRSGTKALEDKSEKQCKDFYRELFDLHWTEFQMWREGLIPDHVMKSWWAIRSRNYRDNVSLQFEKDGQTVTVSYRQVWDELEHTKYFEPEPKDQYLTLMHIIHEDKDTNMKKLRQELKKK